MTSSKFYYLNKIFVLKNEIDKMIFYEVLVINLMIKTSCNIMQIILYVVFLSLIYTIYTLYIHI